MNNKIKIIIIISVAVLVMCGSLLVRQYLERVPDNDPSAIGNTSGNINNGGLFSEHEGRIYFSNSFDNGYLYSMNPDETDLKLIAKSPVRNILTAGNYIYYYLDTSEANGTGLGYVVRNYGIFRSSLDGKKVRCLDRESAVTMQLLGNYIYYQRYNNTDFTKIYKVRINGNDPEKIMDEIINPAAAYNGTIYYNGQDKDHYLYALNPDTNQSHVVYEGNLWYPTYANGYIYYMDVANNYRLCRYSLSSATVEILTNDRVDTFNVGDYNIYYQKNDKNEPALMRMNLDGSNPEIVATGNYTDINLTSYYAYFRYFGDKSTTYHTPVYGSINVSPFNAAMEAAMNTK